MFQQRSALLALRQSVDRHRVDAEDPERVSQLAVDRPTESSRMVQGAACFRNQDEQYGVSKAAQLATFTVNLEKLGSACLVKANAPEQIRKTRVVAHRIREGFYLDPLQDTALLLVRTFEPGKRLVIVAEAHISLNERSRRNVALLPASVQLGNETECIRTSASMPVRSG